MQSKNRWIRRLPLLMGILLSILVAVAVYVLKDRFQKGPQTKRVVQQITVLPPPPPPPPPEIKPPEPEIKQEKIEEPEPEQEPEPAPEQAEEPPGEQLGVEGQGSAGADGFGLAARQGGRSLLGGTAGSAVLWYGGQVRQYLDEALYPLLEETPARQLAYSVMVDVWIGADGHLSRVELAHDSGHAEVDQALRTALAKLHLTVPKPPPENMPQPIRIRLHSRL